MSVWWKRSTARRETGDRSRCRAWCASSRRRLSPISGGRTTVRPADQPGVALDAPRRSHARAVRPHEAIEAEEDDGADHRHDEPGRLALAVEPDHAAQPPTEERANDPEHDGDDDAAGIAARHDELGHDSHHQTEDDPQQNIHSAPLSTKR